MRTKEQIQRDFNAGCGHIGMLLYRAGAHVLESWFVFKALHSLEQENAKLLEATKNEDPGAESVGTASDVGRA